MRDRALRRLLAYPEPRRRSLQIFAVDPMVARLSGNEVVTITVPYEPLEPGPSGELVQVIDYDGGGQVLLRAGRPRRSAAAGAGRADAQRARPAVPPADGVRGDQRAAGELRARAGPAVPVAWRTSGCASSRTRSRARTRVFDPDMDGSLQFGYFRADAARPRPQPARAERLHLPVATTSSSTRRPTRWSTDCGTATRSATNMDVYAFHEGFADAGGAVPALHAARSASTATIQQNRSRPDRAARRWSSWPSSSARAPDGAGRCAARSARSPDPARAGSHLRAAPARGRSSSPRCSTASSPPTRRRSPT